LLNSMRLMRRRPRRTAPAVDDAAVQPGAVATVAPLAYSTGDRLP